MKVSELGLENELGKFIERQILSLEVRGWLSRKIKYLLKLIV